MDTFRINPLDNVCVDLLSGHKIACCDINAGDDVIKYGMPIGQATCFIKSGDSVHSHNMKTKLGDLLGYKYNKRIEELPCCEPFNIMAYVRKNGDIGIRNDIFIIPTVGCVNSTAKAIADKTGAIHVTHPYGCSQLGDDMSVTQQILKGLIKHPNAGGVLVLGLGCENNNIEEMKKVLGDIDTDRIRFLNTQDCEDEISEGVEIICQLQKQAENDVRESVPASKLKIGLKCGGSDGYSGITANPLVGVVTDRLVSMGATAVLTEVPEMFGAETVLFERCESEDVFNKCVNLINNFKQYFKDHGEPVSENPSPGNKEGGITTLEEKSLGCVQKGGKAPVVDVLDYGDTALKPGLNLLNGPGNDIVSVTNLTACGCHMVLFTTGRGTPLGGIVPTVKIASNEAIAQRKGNWIDFCAYGFDHGQKATELLELLKEIAEGKQTKNELNNCREIAIFKDGVTL